MSYEPSVSILIPTCNRAGLLKSALESLKHIDYPSDRYEVIVIDDGSTDDTKETVMAFVGAYCNTPLPYHLQYLRQEKKGISAAKNLGIAHSKGEIIVTTDDDCEFERDWLKNLLRPFENPEVGAVGGPDRAMPDDPLFTRCVDYTMTSFIGTAGTRGWHGQTRLSVGKYHPRGFNMAIRKDVLDKVRTFIEGFAPGEEIELDYRIEKAGYQLCYAHDAYVWHKRRGNLWKFARQIFSRGRSRMDLARISSELLEISHIIPAIMLVLGIILLTLSFFNPVAYVVALSTFSCYLLILIISGIYAVRYVKDTRAIFMVPFLLLTQHILYGAGFLWGIIHGKRVCVNGISLLVPIPLIFLLQTLEMPFLFSR
ncbi:MAG TPA: glycosyltransferase [Candidatus Brocadiia bacterium]|nr:glycosyltransferase [Candidatus Brocadiales bacterium]